MSINVTVEEDTAKSMMDLFTKWKQIIALSNVIRDDVKDPKDYDVVLEDMKSSRAIADYKKGDRDGHYYVKPISKVNDLQVSFTLRWSLKYPFKMPEGTMRAPTRRDDVKS